MDVFLSIFDVLCYKMIDNDIAHEFDLRIGIIGS